MSDTTLTRRRRTRSIVAAIAIALFAVGLLIDSLPSQSTHDRYWFLFVAPSMIGFLAGVIALPMLVWSLIQRRGDEWTRTGTATLSARCGSPWVHTPPSAA